jgi:hypothetical protein
MGSGFLGPRPERRQMGPQAKGRCSFHRSQELAMHNIHSVRRTAYSLGLWQACGLRLSLTGEGGMEAITISHKVPHRQSIHSLRPSDTLPCRSPRQTLPPVYQKSEQKCPRIIASAAQVWKGPTWKHDSFKCLKITQKWKQIK